MAFSDYRELSRTLDDAEHRWISHLIRCPRNHDADIHGNTECPIGQAVFAEYQRIRQEWLNHPII